MHKYILDDDNRPVLCDDILAWGRWFEGSDDKRRVARTDVIDGYVSTVFLGLDHSFTHGEPVLWETMIFGGPHNGYQDRYTSLVAARAGHARAVELASFPAAGESKGEPTETADAPADDAREHAEE